MLAYLQVVDNKEEGVMFRWAKERILIGMVMSLPLIVVGLAVKLVVVPLMSGAGYIGGLITSNGFKATILGIVLIFLVWLVLGIIGDALSVDEFANSLRKKIPSPRFIKFINYARAVRKSKAPEVMFEFTPGVWKKGILRTDKPRTYDEISRELYPVWEPHPVSAGGEIYYLEKGRFFKTGRPGIVLINEIVFGYGMNLEE